MKTARAYCALVEHCEDFETRAFVEQCLRLVSNLFSQAMDLALPDVRGKLDSSRVTHEEWQAMFERLQAKLGQHDSYWMVFEPHQTAQPEAIYGSISDDLADIWRDLKNGLLAARAGQLVHAVWEWRFSFETHWGPNHAAHVFRPLHGLLFGVDKIATAAVPLRARKLPRAK